MMHGNTKVKFHFQCCPENLGCEGGEGIMLYSGRQGKTCKWLSCDLNQCCLVGAESIKSLKTHWDSSNQTQSLKSGDMES